MNKIIGIDLGTTNSCVSVYEGQECTVIPNSEGTKTTPSVVAITDTSYKCGSPAKRQLISNPEHTIYSIKKFMGESFFNIKSICKEVTYPIIPNANGMACVDLNGSPILPQQISAQILLKLKNEAEEYLNHPIHDAVITVPAYFNETQREATKQAGIIAGMNITRIISEPTAAALAYGLFYGNDNQKLAVFDLGGGTFDISILEYENDFYEVKATCGNTHLGGDDFDQQIVLWMANEFKKIYHIDLLQNLETKQRLVIAAEQAKIELSSTTFTEIEIPYITVIDAQPVHLKLTLTRHKFEKLIEDVIQKCLEPCYIALKNAGCKPEEIDSILLVGGSTRIPSVRKLVTQLFGKEPTLCSNPDEIVSIGAAAYGALHNRELENVYLLDVTPLSLGIETEHGRMTVIVKSNSSIPCTFSETFSTATDNQEEVTIHVLQGDNTNASKNKSIGRFNLKDITPMEAGKAEIKVTFDIDKEGLLHVTAIDELTGNSKIVNMNTNYGMSDKEIEKFKSEIQQQQQLNNSIAYWKELKDKAEQNIDLVKQWLSSEKNLAKFHYDTIHSYIKQYEDIIDTRNIGAINHIIEKINSAWEQAKESIENESY